MVPAAGRPSALSLFIPKIVTCLREGYGLAALRRDALAGLTVAIVALPLSMALAIASGAPPQTGLYTAVVAGFLISALGGSRFQIGGPTGAFVVVVFKVIQDHGYDGLLLATLMAGLMVAALGAARLGTIIKYIPYPVITGFTAGIGVIIFVSQIQDLLGLTTGVDTAEIIPRLAGLVEALPTLQPATAAVGLLSLAVILMLRRWRPHWPGFLVAIILASGFVWLFALPVDTIDSRFGGIPSSLPIPSLPDITFAKMRAVLPAAVTIALLCAIESLLSAVVADGIAGTRHRSNCELVAQGVANVASPLFGGLPATGAIARTATNIRAGGRTPVAGMLHAVFILVFMLVAAPVAGLFPLASLAAVLVVVAWNMSEPDKVVRLFRAPRGDVVVMGLTFALTVLVDITIAVNVGVMLAALLFVKRMVEQTAIVQRPGPRRGPASGPAEPRPLLAADEADRLRDADSPIPIDIVLPPGVAVLHLRGPVFFGAAWRLDEAAELARAGARLMIIDMAAVPFIDATGAHSLDEFVARADRKGIGVVLAGANPAVRLALRRLRIGRSLRRFAYAPSVAAAIARAGQATASHAPDASLP